MKIRTTPSSQFDHRLDALESRSLFSAAPIAHPAHGAHAPAAIVADAAFLNAGSDATPASASSANDADMYNFDAAPANRAAAALDDTISADSNDYQADPGHAGMWNTPSDLSTTVPGYGESAPYSGDVNIDLGTQPDQPEEQVIPADSPVAPPAAPLATVNQPVAVAPAAPAPAPSAYTAPANDTPMFVWLDTAQTSGKSAKDKAAMEQVVIVSNFVAN